MENLTHNLFLFFSRILYHLPAFAWILSSLIILYVFIFKKNYQIDENKNSFRTILIASIITYFLIYYVIAENILKISYLNYQIESAINLLLLTTLDILLFVGYFKNIRLFKNNILNKFNKIYCKLRVVYLISVPIRIYTSFILSGLLNSTDIFQYYAPEMNYQYTKNGKGKFFLPNTFFDYNLEPHKEKVNYIREYDGNIPKIYKILNSIYKSELNFRNQNYVYLGRFNVNDIPKSIKEIIKDNGNDIEHYNSKINYYNLELSKSSIDKSINQVDYKDSFNLYLGRSNYNSSEKVYCYECLFRKKEISLEKIKSESDEYFALVKNYKNFFRDHNLEIDSTTWKYYENFKERKKIEYTYR